MQQLLKFGVRSIIKSQHVAAWVAAIAVVLTFSVVPVHQFSPHFRSPDLGRWTEGHTNAAQPETSAAGRIAPTIALERTIPALVQIDSASSSLVDIELASEVPLARLLKRLKLGPSRTANSDPLI